jgi:polyhydroxybutyrate depolymerase
MKLLLAITSLIVFCFAFAQAYALVSASFRTQHFVLPSGREYYVHTPIGHSQDSSEKFPLLIALHGYTDHPRWFEFYTGWSRKADFARFIVVYPQGTHFPDDKGPSWNAGFCCGGAAVHDVDDVGFISELVETLTQRYVIDTDRIYVTGFSNGGILAYRLAAELPDTFEAVGVIAASNAGTNEGTQPFISFLPPVDPPIRAIMLHGDQDTVIPYAGGPNYAHDRYSTSFEEVAESWENTLPCATDPVEEQMVADKVLSKKYWCDDRLWLQTVTFKGGDHIWFGSHMEWLNLFKRQTIDASELIWIFFSH